MYNKYLLIILFIHFTLLISCAKKKANTKYIDAIFFYPPSGVYVKFQLDGSLYYDNRPSTVDQYLNAPEDGFLTNYQINKHGLIDIFHIDLPSETATKMIFSKSQNRLHLYLGPPVGGESYLLIKYDHNYTELLELYNVH